MPVHIVTVPFDPERQVFQDDDLRKFLLNKRVIALRPEFFQVYDQAYWSIFVEYESVSPLERIIRNTRTPGKGLPIGNLTSQFFANVYLDPCDHLIKEQWGLKAYVRYMDDLVIFGDTATELREIRQRLAQFLHERLALQLHEAVTVIQRSAHGLSFLGLRIFPAFIRMRPANRRRSLRRLKQAQTAWQHGDLTEEQMQQKMTSLTGHLKYFSPQVSLPPGEA